MAANHPPDLILLDLGLPDENGHIVLQKLRKWYTNPVVILSVQKSEEDIIRALDNGANDYLSKPFRTGELLARIRSALRVSNSEEGDTTLSFADLEIDLYTRSVKKAGELIKLTATEFNLLSLLVRNDGKVLTHQYLLRAIWGPGYINQSQYLRVYIAQLRKKIEADPNNLNICLQNQGLDTGLLEKFFSHWMSSTVSLKSENDNKLYLYFTISHGTKFSYSYCRFIRLYCTNGNTWIVHGSRYDR
jgi:two-component system KDP operon response regulator KdpE